MGEIKLIITDLDGTLIDTFKANYFAYRKAFKESGYILNLKDYKASFGLRFDRLIEKAGVLNTDQKRIIKERKRQVYPDFFRYLKLNAPLMTFLKVFRYNGGLVAIASTAERSNLNNVITYFGINDSFDLILTGDEVINGKPDPEIYLSVMRKLDVNPSSTLIFEDSEIGVKAAIDSGASCIRITSGFFKDFDQAGSGV